MVILFLLVFSSGFVLKNKYSDTYNLFIRIEKHKIKFKKKMMIFVY